MEKREIENLIREIVEKTTIPVKEIIVSEDASNTTWFSLEVDHPHLFLSRGGEALFSLNHLIKKIIESRILQKNNEQTKSPLAIIIDINGFQKKRIDNIHATAHMMAERARYFKSSIEVDPMPAFERRIVHEFLSEAPDLKTESTGEGPSRRVVIKYIGDI